MSKQNSVYLLSRVTSTASVATCPTFKNCNSNFLQMKTFFRTDENTKSNIFSGSDAFKALTSHFKSTKFSDKIFF